MGIDKELIRKILGFDCELKFQTMCLREEGDQPFEHTSKITEPDESEKTQ